MDEQQFREWISEEIERFVREDPGNRLERLDGSPIFQQPQALAIQLICIAPIV